MPLISSHFRTFQSSTRKTSCKTSRFVIIPKLYSLDHDQIYRATDFSPCKGKNPSGARTSPQRKSTPVRVSCPHTHTHLTSWLKQWSRVAFHNGPDNFEKYLLWTIQGWRRVSETIDLIYLQIPPCHNVPQNLTAACVLLRQTPLISISHEPYGAKMSRPPREHISEVVQCLPK